MLSITVGFEYNCMFWCYSTNRYSGSGLYVVLEESQDGLSEGTRLQFLLPTVFQALKSLFTECVCVCARVYLYACACASV